VLTESGAASKINGTLVECWDELSKLNTSAAAWQIYFVVNEGGHSAADITRVRALFVDMDDGPIPDRWHVEPDFLTSRGPRNWHAYWLVNDMPREEFESAQLRLIQHYGSDRGIHDLPRIMRLAGSLHVKASPKGDGVVRLFTVEKMRAGKCRSSAELLTGLRQIAATPASEHVVNSDLAAADLLDLATAMQTIGNPDLEWGDWNNLGMAIWSASGGSEAGEIDVAVILRQVTGALRVFLGEDDGAQVHCDGYCRRAHRHCPNRDLTSVSSRAIGHPRVCRRSTLAIRVPPAQEAWRWRLLGRVQVSRAGSSLENDALRTRHHRSPITERRDRNAQSPSANRVSFRCRYTREGGIRTRLECPSPAPLSSTNSMPAQ
jgi:hypothetical protein